MKSQLLPLLAATLALTLFSIDSYASTNVYTQTPISGSATSAVLNASSDPGFNWTSDSDQQLWDYFNVGSSNVSFNRISWYGTNADGKFAVDLFSATCFSCGATPVNGGGTFSHTLTPQNSLSLLPNAGPFSQAQVHKSLVSGNLYSYYIDFTSLLTLDHTKTYAMSIVNNYSSLPFNWEISNTSGPHLQYNIGQAMFLPGPYTMAFTLTNTSASVVPEPSSTLLLGSGLAYLLGFARKRVQ